MPRQRKGFFPPLQREDQTGNRLSDLVRQAALPGGVGVGLGRRLGSTEASYGEGSVEILPDPGDHPIIGDGPCVDPEDRTALVAALGDHERSERDDCLRDEGEGLQFSLLVGQAGEEAHQIQVARGAVEPPLEVWGKETVDGVGVAGMEGVVECSHG